MVKGWGSEGFLRNWACYEVTGVRHDPGGSKICVIECVFSKGTIIWLRVGV